jgi:hypothetical protein
MNFQNRSAKMFKLKRKICGIAPSIIILAAMLHSNVFASTFTLYIPPDFFLVSTSTGVSLYQKNYQNGNSDFVQVIDLGQGASVKFLHGFIINPGIGQGVYGGNNPEISRQTIQQVWNEFSSANENAFCVTNGQFFSTNDNPTKLAFPLKLDGNIISDGYGINEFQNPNQKLLLEVWDNRADIIPLTQEALHSSSAPNILAGLTENANKNPYSSVGRTFAGVVDNDEDGYYEILLIFNSKTATQAHAADILRSFGADKIIMFDGGGSTQLICQDTPYIESSRLIPQTLTVISSTTLSSDSFWENIQHQILEWWRNQSSALSEWWDEQQEAVAVWWEEMQAELEQNIENWLDEMERQIMEWIEIQLDQIIIQLCGGAVLPGGLILWAKRNKLIKAE